MKNSSIVEFFPVVEQWRRLKRHLNDSELNRILVSDFNKFTYGQWRKTFEPGMLPSEFENCDWRLGIRGRIPRYFDYVKHAACHWLVNFNLRLATLAIPKKPWRIVTSRFHSTVWDGEETLFDFNALALGFSPAEAWELAWSDRKQLAIGKYRKTHPAIHYSLHC